MNTEQVTELLGRLLVPDTAVIKQAEAQPWPALQRALVNRTPARSRNALPQHRHLRICFGCPQIALLNPVEQTPTPPPPR